MEHILAIPIYIAGCMVTVFGAAVVCAHLVTIILDKIGLISFAVRGIKREYKDRKNDKNT